MDKTLVINAHAGETFVGIVEDDVFVEHEVVRSSVMGKHSKAVGARSGSRAWLRRMSGTTQTK